MSEHVERYFALGLAVLLVVVAWLFLPNLANAFVIKTWVALLGCLFLIGFLVLRLGAGILLPPRTFAVAALLLLITTLLFSVLFAANLWLALAAGFEILIPVLLVVAILNLARFDHIQRRLENALLVAGAGVALFALKQFLLPDVLDPGFHALGKMKIYSTLGNPNLSALFMLPAVPVAAFRFLHATGQERLAHGVLILLLMAGIAATQSRHVLLAILVMTIVAALWQSPPRWRQRLWVMLGIGALLGFALLLVIELPPPLLHSIKGRWFIWSTATQMLWQHPLAGVGVGHFGLAHPDFQARMFATGTFNNYFDNAALIEEAHNQFLHWGATAGFGAMLGFLTLSGAVLWNGWHSAAVRTRAAPLYLALVGYLVAMLFVAILAYTAIALVFWIILAVVWRHYETPRKIKTAPGFAQVIVLLLLISAIVVTQLGGMRDVRGGYHEARGDRLMEAHDSWGALREYQRGLIACPNCNSLHRKQAGALLVAGQLELALQEVKSAQSRSGDVALNILEGEILTRLQRLDEAVAVYMNISATFPKMVSPRFILAQIYVLQGKYNDAAREFQAVLEIEPSPYNLNLTTEKIDLQKDIARQYLLEHAGAVTRIP